MEKSQYENLLTDNIRENRQGKVTLQPVEKYIKYIVYINIHKFTSLPVNAIVRLPHPRSGDSQGQATFLALSAAKKTRDCDAECKYHRCSLSTLMLKGLSGSKIKWWAIYTNLPVNAIIRLPHPQSGDWDRERTWPEKAETAEITSQLVSVMRLASGQYVKCVQITHLASVSSLPLSTLNITVHN